MDLFGVLVVSVVTGLGDGILRDLPAGAYSCFVRCLSCFAWAAGGEGVMRSVGLVLGLSPGFEA